MPESSGDLTQKNGIGFAFFGKWHPCKICRSVIRRERFTLLFVPTFGLKYYRVLQTTPDRFFSLKVRPEVVKTLGL
jgi:hypothetical protein